MRATQACLVDYLSKAVKHVGLLTLFCLASTACLQRSTEPLPAASSIDIPPDYMPAAKQPQQIWRRYAGGCAPPAPQLPPSEVWPLLGPAVSSVEAATNVVRSLGRAGDFERLGDIYCQVGITCSLDAVHLRNALEGRQSRHTCMHMFIHQDSAFKSNALPCLRPSAGCSCRQLTASTLASTHISLPVLCRHPPPSRTGIQPEPPAEGQEASGGSAGGGRRIAHGRTFRRR